MEIWDKLKSLAEPVPNPPALPTEEDLKNAEEKLGVKFPPSYKKYQLEYSDVILGSFELYQLFEDGSYTDLIYSVREARAYGLPEHLLPFLDDNGDYYCFDLTSNAPEYVIRFWSPNGTSNEKWGSFPEWVEKCWIGEHA